MSRLRRLLVSHRIFFITTHFRETALPVAANERDAVLRATEETRLRRKFLLFAYVVMPTHFHLLFAPDANDAMSTILREIKLRAAKRILALRGTPGPLWQARSFDRIIRNRKEWSETLEYIHWNPVKDELVKHPSEWHWSSWFGRNAGGAPPIPVDIIDLPIHEKAPLSW